MDRATSSFHRAHPLLLSWPLAPPRVVQTFTLTKCLQKRRFSLAGAGDQWGMRDWKNLHVASWTLWSCLAKFKSKGSPGSWETLCPHLLQVKGHRNSTPKPKMAWTQLRDSTMDPIPQSQLCECISWDNSVGVPKFQAQPNTTVGEVTLQEEWVT